MNEIEAWRTERAMWNRSCLAAMRAALKDGKMKELEYWRAMIIEGGRES